MKARTASLVLAVLLAWPSPGQSENVLRWASAISGLTFDPHAFNHYPTRAQNLQVYEPLVDFDSDYTKLAPARRMRVWQGPLFCPRSAQAAAASWGQARARRINL